MPRAPLRHCPHPLCSALVEAGEQYCAKHRPSHTHAENLRRGSSASRGYGSRWRKLRAIKLAEQPLCQWPGCTKAATDVDHIVPRLAGGTDADANLQCLCHEHHSLKTAREDGGFGNSRPRSRGG